MFGEKDNWRWLEKDNQEMNEIISIMLFNHKFILHSVIL